VGIVVASLTSIAPRSPSTRSTRIPVRSRPAGSRPTRRRSWGGWGALRAGTGIPGAAHAAIGRVAGAVARPGSHRTVLALFAHGSSGRRVANPAVGR
jgi:hypothetical protein